MAMNCFRKSAGSSTCRSRGAFHARPRTAATWPWIWFRTGASGSAVAGEPGAAVLVGWTAELETVVDGAVLDGTNDGPDADTRPLPPGARTATVARPAAST